MDLNKITARELIEKYGLQDNTIDFIGHALALFNDDKYLDHPAMDFVKRMKVEFDNENPVGVTSEGETAKCKKGVVCDPSYLPDKVKKVGKVARAICIMNHLIPDTNDSHSAQIILPQKELGRSSDMFEKERTCPSYRALVRPADIKIANISEMV